MQFLRNEGWENIWNEVGAVVKNIGWPESLQEENKRTRKRKRTLTEEDCEDENVESLTAEMKFKREVFYVILDQVIGDITIRFTSIHELCKLFSVLWEFRNLSEGEIKNKTTDLVRKYSTDLQQEELVDEINGLKSIFVANFGHETMQPLELINALQKANLTRLFPNLCIAIRIYLTIPATVAGAERAFSVLKRIKNVMRSTMCQDRLSSLGILSVEAQLAKEINVEAIIEDFASKKIRKASLY